MAASAMFSTQGIARKFQADFAKDIREGLTKAGQKELPSKYLYDELGSALFEAICLLPEYGLNRAGRKVDADVRGRARAALALAGGGGRTG